jgi:hypothetical protein
VRAEKPETLMDDLAALGARFIHGLGDMKPEDAALRTVDQLAQMRTGKPWLLIYDNADGPSLLRGFTPADNAQALSHARAYCWARNWSFDKYAARVAELLAVEEPDTHPVFGTFSLAIEKAAKECAEAETLMAFLAFFAPDKIPLWLIPDDMLSENQRDDALVALTSVSLAAHDNLPDGTPAISVHRLVQEVMRGRLRKSERSEKTAALAIKLLVDAYDEDSDKVETMYRRAAWLPHALAALDQDKPFHAGTERLAWGLHIYIGDFRVSRGELDPARVAYEEGLRIAGRLAKTDPHNAGWQRDLSVSQASVATILEAQGNLSEALAGYRKTLEIQAGLATSNPDNAGWQRDLSVSHNNVGNVQVAQGNLPEALNAYRAGLRIAERLAARPIPKMPAGSAISRYPTTT